MTLVENIIKNNFFSLASGVVISDDDEARKKLEKLYLTSAAQTVSDYLGYDVNELKENDVVKSAYMSLTITNSFLDKIKNTVLRIATLLQAESNGNIGVDRSSEFGTSRSFVNVVDYTPYLRPLSSWQLVGSQIKKEATDE